MSCNVSLQGVGDTRLDVRSAIVTGLVASGLNFHCREFHV